MELGLLELVYFLFVFVVVGYGMEEGRGRGDGYWFYCVVGLSFSWGLGSFFKDLFRFFLVC